MSLTDALTIYNIHFRSEKQKVSLILTRSWEKCNGKQTKAVILKQAERPYKPFQYLGLNRPSHQMLVHINIHFQQVLQLLKISDYNICPEKQPRLSTGARLRAADLNAGCPAPSRQLLPEGRGHEPHGPGARAQLQHRAATQRVGPVAREPRRLQVFGKDDGGVPHNATYASRAVLLQSKHRPIPLLQNPHKAPQRVFHFRVHRGRHCCHQRLRHTATSRPRKARAAQQQSGGQFHCACVGLVVRKQQEPAEPTWEWPGSL